MARSVDREPVGQRHGGKSIWRWRTTDARPQCIHDGVVEAAPPGALVDLHEQKNLGAVQILVA
jgi:hypothetical protein